MEVRERLSLESANAEPLLVSEHLHRYEFARALCTGRSVIDLCCGSGYGSEILRETALAVTGVDNDAATVDTAAARIGAGSDVKFEIADATEYLRRDEAKRSDMLVCFEGLEHLADLERTLECLRELAADGMRMVLSVPNSRAFGEENKFHLTDFGYEEAVATFEQIGPTILVYQFLAEGSIMHTGEPGDLETSAVLPEYGEPEWSNHFISLINFEPDELPHTLASHASIALAPNANRHSRNLERANTELWRTNARLGRELLACREGRPESHAATGATSVQLRLQEAEAARFAAEARIAELEARIARTEQTADQTRPRRFLRRLRHLGRDLRGMG